MSQPVISAPYAHDGSSVSGLMRETCLALVPGMLVYALVISPGIIIQCLLAIIFSVSFEAMILKVRKLPIKLFLADYSVVVTSLLFALSIPPWTPWWVNLCGTLFAVALIKHAYGGIGNNLFNPAMAGVAILLLSFPTEMSNWPTGSSLQKIPVEFSDIMNLIFPDIQGSAVTFFNYAQLQTEDTMMTPEFNQASVIVPFGTGWEWVTLAFLLGGSWLVVRKIITWQVPVTFLGTMFLISLFFYWSDRDVYLSPLLHLLSTSSLLGAFFIITDPVSSAATPWGKILFAIGAGLTTYVLRTWGAYPDGLCFAILLMNSTVPLLDHYVRPKVFGEVTIRISNSMD